MKLISKWVRGDYSVKRNNGSEINLGMQLILDLLKFPNNLWK